MYAIIGVESKDKLLKHDYYSYIPSQSVLIYIENNSRFRLSIQNDSLIFSIVDLNNLDFILKVDFVKLKIFEVSGSLFGVNYESGSNCTIINYFIYPIEIIKYFYSFCNFRLSDSGLALVIFDFCYVPEFIKKIKIKLESNLMCIYLVGEIYPVNIKLLPNVDMTDFETECLFRKMMR